MSWGFNRSLLWSLTVLYWLRSNLAKGPHQTDHGMFHENNMKNKLFVDQAVSRCYLSVCVCVCVCSCAYVRCVHRLCSCFSFFSERSVQEFPGSWIQDPLIWIGKGLSYQLCGQLLESVGTQIAHIGPESLLRANSRVSTSNQMHKNWAREPLGLSVGPISFTLSTHQKNKKKSLLGSSI